MKKAALRWIRRLLVLSVCAGLLAAVAHTRWVRGLVLGQVTSRLSARTGLAFSADALDYNLFSMTATVDGLQINRPGRASPPMLRVRQATIALSPRILSGTIEAERIDADGAALVIDLTPHPGDAAAPTDGAPAPFQVPVFTTGRAVLRHASIEVVDPGGLGRLQVLDVSLDLAGNGPGRLEGAFTAAGGLSLDNENTRARVDRIEGRAFLDGDRIGVTPTSAVAGGQRLALDGSVVLTGPSPQFDLGIEGTVDVGQIASWFPALPAGSGPLQLASRITGPLTNPQFRYSARSTGVTLPDIRLPASSAEGYISRAGIHVDRLRTGVGGGSVEVRGRLPLGPDDPTSRFSLTWNNVPIASLAKIFPSLPADPIGIVATGSAEVNWPGMAMDFATIAGHVTSELRFAPALPPARVSVEASPGQWALRGQQETDDGTRADLDVTIVVSQAGIAGSAVQGTLRLASENVRPALADAQRAFAGLPVVSAWIDDTPLTFDGIIDGTLGEPRLSGTASSDTLRLNGLPALHAVATFAVDPAGLTVSSVRGDDGAGNVVEARGEIAFTAATTSGAFTADLGNPEPLLAAILARDGRRAEADAVKASGTVSLAGTWDGPMADPIVAITAKGTAFSVAGAAFGVEGGALEGRVDGPVSAPKAALRVSAGALRVASLRPASAEANVSLEAGQVQVDAHVPAWSASLTGQMSAEAPHEFATTLLVTDLTASRLVELLGVKDPDWSADGTFSATLDAAGMFDNRTLRLGGRTSLAGGGIGIGESRVLEGLDASAEVRDGRLWLTRLAGRGFSGPLTASGDVPISWLEEYLPNGWRVEGASASSKPASFALRAEPDMKAVGAWLGSGEPEELTGSVILQMTGTAAAPSVGALDGRITVQPGTVRMSDVVFTLPRAAEVRIKDGRASAEGLTLTAPGTTASVSGTLGLAGDRPIDARVSASGALGFLSAVVPGRLAGVFNATFSATGTAADPKVSGSLALDDASWVWQEQRLAFRDWSGEAALSADTLTIKQLEGLANGGDASVSGAIQFGRQGGAGLQLRVRDLFAEVVKGFRSQADVDLILASTSDGARLSGKVTVTSGAYREPLTVMARQFGAPRKTAAVASGESSVLGSIALDVDLTASSPITIENSAGRLDLMPSMKLQGSLAEPAFVGTLDMVDEGRLTLLGRTFRLTEARVAFPGVGDPSVRLIGETRVGDYAVTLRTQGPVTDMEATYTSDPPLSQRDVQSLLVTGRTSDAADTKGGADEEFVLGSASSDLLGVAGQMVGLDSVQLGRGDFELGSSDVNPAMRLTVSKRINARTSLVLSQNLDDNKLTWILVFSPAHGYEVRLSQRDGQEEVVEFRQEISFGPGVSPPRRSGLRTRSGGPRVSSLTFEGVPGYPASELESEVKLKPSNAFDVGTWQEDRARLESFYRNRGYATARIVPRRAMETGQPGERVRLTYRVDPGPRTVLNVSGVDLSKGDRQALMQIWSQSVLPEFLPVDLTRHLRDLMAERGHLRPSIAVALDVSDPQVILANVDVEPGPVTKTRTLVFEGGGAIAEPELRAALSGSPALESAWVDPAPLVEAVSAIYAERGYPSALVSADDLTFDGSTAERRLRVVEGRQAVVKEIAVTGVADTRAAGARSAIALQPGQPLLPGTEAEARQRLRRFYLDRGFRSAEVRSSSTSGPDGRVDTIFSVTEGPMSIVNTIAVTGLDATKPSVANGAITLKAGEPAGQREISATQKRLYGLGVFRSADISFEPAMDAKAPDAATAPVDMTVSLEEARRFQVRYGVQLSNQYGPVFDDLSSALGVAADARDRNFLGRAFTLGASTRLEKNLQSLRGQFSLPLLLNQRLQTNYFVTIRSETDTSPETVAYQVEDRDVMTRPETDASAEAVGYRDKERDVTFEQRLRLPRSMEVSWGYSYNMRDVTFMGQSRIELDEFKGALATLNGTFILDARDKPFDASRGWFQSSNVQYGAPALGSDFKFFRVLLRQFYYKTAGPFVFASGLRWGWLHGIVGDPPATIFDRYFDAGGAQTVRGYAEDSLSAVEVLGVPLGGTKLLLLNQEIRFPLFSRWLQGAAFVDAGNTFAPRSPLKLNELAVGVGFGIRIMTPFAPIRIDVGYPWDRRAVDRPYRIHFSVGQIF